MLYAAPASGQPHLSASATAAQITTLTLLLQVSATVTDYRRHHRSLFFMPGIISLFIMCVGIIRNNSLLEGGRARTNLWTRLPRRVMLHCTWRTSALTTELHGKVLEECYNTAKYFINRLGLWTVHCRVTHWYWDEIWGDKQDGTRWDEWDEVRVCRNGTVWLWTLLRPHAKLQFKTALLKISLIELRTSHPVQNRSVGRLSSLPVSGLGTEKN